MKKVFTNSHDVIHLFANQVQQEARCSNVFFNEDYSSELNYATKIYSYGHHYLLGEFIDANTIVINDEGYSVTTSKHISQIRQATSHKRQFFTMETDLNNVLASVKWNAVKLVTARKPELYVLPSLRLWSKLNEFIEYTGRKAMKRTPEFKQIKKLIDAIEANPKTAGATMVKAEKTRVKKEARRIEVQRKKEVAEFRNHERDYLNVAGIDYLRLSKPDGLFIETSQRVKVPIKEARRLLKLIDAKKVIGAKVNDTFTVTAFNGALKVGCHNVPIEEIDAIRTQI